MAEEPQTRDSVAGAAPDEPDARATARATAIQSDPAPWERGAVEAEAHVIEALSAEPQIAELIDAFGPYRWNLQPPLRALVGSIVSQSVSGASADAVFRRLEAETGVTAEGILAASRESLRATGLSWSKVDSIQRVAAFSREGNLDDIAGLGDDAVAERLTQLKGIGPWTAEMFLLFCLGRPDVWPVGDLTVRQQIERRYGVEGRPAVQQVGDRFRPHRSAVVWYLWRANG